MEPELIGTFATTGSDGKSRNVQVWMTFHQIDSDMYDPRKVWVPDGLATLTTEAGEEVWGVEGEEGKFGVGRSGVVLTAGGPVEGIFSEFDAMYRQRMGYRPRNEG